jgi:DNA repair protein RadC
MKKSYTIHDLPPNDRPRERLQQVGADNLSVQELLALIIERGRPGLNVLSIAQNLLAEFGNLKRIKEASLKELQEVKGVGKATACKLQAAFKVGEKAQNNCKRYGQKIDSPEDVFKLLKDKIGNKKREHFVILSLDSRDCLININNNSIGILDSSLAHPREIFHTAIRNSANSIILAHNHPSGNPEPSDGDIRITKKLSKASELIGIKIKDHIIVGSDKFISLKDKKFFSF